MTIGKRRSAEWRKTGSIFRKSLRFGWGLRPRGVADPLHLGLIGTWGGMFREKLVIVHFFKWMFVFGWMVDL